MYPDLIPVQTVMLYADEKGGTKLIAQHKKADRGDYDMPSRKTK
jgi:hypothetical protein